MLKTHCAWCGEPRKTPGDVRMSCPTPLVRAQVLPLHDACGQEWRVLLHEGAGRVLSDPDPGTERPAPPADEPSLPVRRC